MFVPNLRHWYVRPVPVATTVNVAEEPVQRASDDGLLVIDGAEFTVSVAAVVVALPQELVATQS